MMHEMYLLKSAQHQSGEHVGVDEERNSYQGIVVFVVVRFKLSIPVVVQAIADVTFNEQWMTVTFSGNIDNLIKLGLRVQVIVTDNHSANVNAFSAVI